MIMNRVADLAYVIAVVLTHFCFQTVEFGSSFTVSYFLKESNIVIFNETYSPITIISMLFFIGAMGKSAQIGLHT